MSDKVYFISGGNRGIGLALVKEISSRANTKVLTTARLPGKAVELQQLVKERGNIHIIKYDASLKEDAIELGRQVGKLVDGIDVFISNAAIAESVYTVLDAPDEVWLNHYNVNVLGPIFLFQALYSHLIKRDTRQILFISSIAGQIKRFMAVSQSAYGQSKAALNHTAKEISTELDSQGFTVVSVHPGEVGTDMGDAVIKELLKVNPNEAEKLHSGFITPDHSALKVTSIVDNLTREDNGTFISYTGERLEW